MVSKEFVTRTKVARLRAYQIAQLAGIHPSTLSKLINGIEQAKPGDSRVIAVGRVLGLKPEECFEGGR